MDRRSSSGSGATGKPEGNPRPLFDEIPLGIFYRSADGVFTDINEAALGILGMKREEFLDDAARNEKFLLLDANRNLLPLEEYPSAIAMRTGTPVRNTPYYLYNKLDDDYRWLIVNALPQFRPGETQPHRVLVTLQDETELKLSKDILAARERLLAFSLDHSLGDLLQKTLDESEQLTGSVIGFLHKYDDLTQNLTLMAWSTRTKKEFCRALGKGHLYHLSKAGVWVDCVHRREPVIHNDYNALTHKKGLPEGHAPLSRELVVPVFRGDRIVAILGVGNKPTPYTKSDILIIQRLTELTWEILERKYAEEARKVSENILTAHLGNSPLAIIEFDPEFRIIRWSGAARQIFGFAPEEVLGKTIHDFRWIYEGDAPAVAAESAGLRDGSRARSLHRNRNYTKDGRVLWCAWHNSGVYDEKGKMISVLSHAQDITETVEAHEALRESERKLREGNRRYQQLVDQAQDGIFSCDSSGRFLFVNEGICAMLGYTAEELLGMTIFDTYPEEELETARLRFAQLKAGSPLKFERVMVGKGGRRVFVESSVWTSEEGLLQAIVRDVTERKALEEKRLEIEQRSFELRKAESLRRMAGAVGHNFNNLMSIVLGNLEFASKLKPMDEEAADCVREAHTAGSRAAKLSGLMLTYLGQDFAKKAYLDLSTLCRDSLKELLPGLPPAVNLAVSLDPALPRILANSGQIAQVLSNLLENAREALGEDGGNIAISTGILPREDLAPERMFPPGWTPSAQRYVYLAVQDDGCGIQEDNREELFDPFYTTKFSGRGLGLPVVLGVAGAHEGAVLVRSGPGRGSLFQVFFPIPPDTREGQGEAA